MDRFVGRYSFSAEKERIVQLKDGALSYQAPGGLPQPLYMLDSLTLFFEDGYRQLVIKPSSGGFPQTLTYHNRKYTETGQRIATKVNTERQAIVLPSETLAQFAGQNQTAHFLMNIIFYGDLYFKNVSGPALGIGLKPDISNGETSGAQPVLSIMLQYARLSKSETRQQSDDLTLEKESYHVKD